MQTTTLAIPVLGALAIVPAIVSAQQADTSGPVVEEVVVTARYRDESLQDVPMSVTAFTEQSLEDARVDQVGDFLGLTPNVTISQAQNIGLSALTIRGISQVRNGEPPVATVVDGVLQINANQFTQELFDIERIEVLRGPQGALYGRNATGGAILITTRQPGNDVEGHVRLGVGDGEERLVQGSISGPLVEDRLLFRVGARYYDRDGYLDNITLGRKADPYEDLTMRSLLRLQASEHLSADLRVNVSRAEGGALNYRFQPANLLPDGTLDLGNPFDFTRSGADLVDRHLVANNMGENERDITEGSLKIDYDAGFATFTSISSYNELMEYAAGDQFPYTASAFNGFGIDGTQTQFLDVSAWSQEFRLTSGDDQSLRWMIGAYYVDTQRFISSTTGGDLGRGIVRIERRPQFASSVNPTASFLADDNDNEARALFGNLAFDLSARLELALALRYDEDQRTQTVSDEQIGGGEPGAVNEASFDKLQPKVTLRYKPAADATVFGSWGRGFRSGQFNQNGVGAVAAAAGIVGVEDRVDEETTDTWELGFKSELFGGTLRLNGGLFHTDVEGQQYFVFIGAVGAQVLVSIDEVRLIGGEIEAVARLAEGFDVYAAYGYTDSSIEAYRLNPAAVGNEAPYVPKSTANLGAQYRWPVSELFSVLARADFERRGRQFWDPENSTARSAIELLNLRLGIEAGGGRWSLTGTVKNVTDEEYNSEWVLGGFAHPALPRTWHVDFRRNF